MPHLLLFREQEHASRNAFRCVVSPTSQARGRALDIPCAGSVWGSAPSSRELFATGPRQQFQRVRSSLGHLDHQAPCEAQRQAAAGTLDQRLQPTYVFKDEHPRLVLLPTCAGACAPSLASGPPVYTVGVPLWRTISKWTGGVVFHPSPDLAEPLTLRHHPSRPAPKGALLLRWPRPVPPGFPC